MHGDAVKRVLRGIVWTLAFVVATAVVAIVAARFRDGPTGPLPGGPLERGELVAEGLTNPESVAAVMEVELQLLEPPRSRTTWIVVHEGALYVPCGFLDVPGFKRWHEEAARDGRALMRIDERRYPGTLVREPEGPVYEAVASKVGEKYAPGAEGFEPDPARLWIFRFDPPAG